MAQIIGVRFKKVGKVYYFDPCGIQVQVGQHVIVETARGVEYGEVALENRDVAEGEVVKPLKRLIRVATDSDRKVVETNEKRAREAFHICEQKIAEHHLDMKLVSVEYTFDLNKVLFYFTADGRVDFRELVKDLASVFRTRIELRQIGVRDEAKVLGGLGICGRPLCCASFLDDFQPVSINMAKQQNLSLNPTKISGTCGRLMCCLKYEQEAYEELGRVTPRPDSTVQTPDGPGVVIDSNLLRGTCLVRLDDEQEEPHTYRCADCTILQAARKQRKPTHGTAAARAAVKPAAKPAVQPEPELELHPLTQTEQPEQTVDKKDKPGKPNKSGKQDQPDKAERTEPAGRDKSRSERPRRRRRNPDRPDKREKEQKGRERSHAAPSNEAQERGGEFMDAHRAPRKRRSRRRPSGKDGAKQNSPTQA